MEGRVQRISKTVVVVWSKYHAGIFLERLILALNDAGIQITTSAQDREVLI